MVAIAGFSGKLNVLDNKKVENADTSLSKPKAYQSQFKSKSGKNENKKNKHDSKALKNPTAFTSPFEIAQRKVFERGSKKTDISDIAEDDLPHLRSFKASKDSVTDNPESGVVEVQSAKRKKTPKNVKGVKKIKLSNIDNPINIFEKVSKSTEIGSGVGTSWE